MTGSYRQGFRNSGSPVVILENGVDGNKPSIHCDWESRAGVSSIRTFPKLIILLHKTGKTEPVSTSDQVLNSIVSLHFNHLYSLTYA
jgi:acyl-coenzyme A synthetase/AMP-(fatty) acid ligase